jgi:hypothetical protein
MNKTTKMLTAIAGLLVAVTGLAAVFFGTDSGPVTIVLDSPETYVDYVREWLGRIG